MCLHRGSVDELGSSRTRLDSENIMKGRTSIMSMQAASVFGSCASKFDPRASRIRANLIRNALMPCACIVDQHSGQSTRCVWIDALRVDQRNACGSMQCVWINADRMDQRCVCESTRCVWIDALCVDQHNACGSMRCAWINAVRVDLRSSCVEGKGQSCVC